MYKDSDEDGYSDDEEEGGKLMEGEIEAGEGAKGNGELLIGQKTRVGGNDDDDDGFSMEYKYTHTSAHDHGNRNCGCLHLAFSTFRKRWRLC